MSRHTHTFAISLLLLLATASPAPSQLPQSAYLDLVPADYPLGVCYLASAAQLIRYHMPELTAAELMTRTGMATMLSLDYLNFRDHTGQRIRGWSLAPHKRIYDTRAKIFGGQSLDLYLLTGLSYAIAYGRGGGGGYTNVKNADQVTLLNDQNDAITLLKQIIATGTPVQVHLDLSHIVAYTQDYYPWHASITGPSSHFVVIHGYDDQYVYYTDNNPISGSADVDSDGQTDGVGVPVPWASFLSAWQATEDLPNDRYTLTGPWFMFYLLQEPQPLADEQVLGYLYDDAYDNSTILRACADELRNGVDPNVTLGQNVRDLKGQMTPHFTQYLEDISQTDAAQIFAQAQALWDIFWRNQFQWPDAPEMLEQMADLYDQGWTLLAPAADLEQGVFAVEPDPNAHLDTPTEITFRWVPLPSSPNRLTVQISSTGDFDDRRSCLTLRPIRGKNYAQMTLRNWWSLLAREDGDAAIQWRVVGRSRDGLAYSEPRILLWDVPTLQSLAPEDGIAWDGQQTLVFDFDAPSVARVPVIIISTTGDFSNRRTLFRLKPRRGETHCELISRHMPALIRRDDSDKLFYWRVEDLLARITTVQPSETRTFSGP